MGRVPHFGPAAEGGDGPRHVREEGLVVVAEAHPRAVVRAVHQDGVHARHRSGGRAEVVKDRGRAGLVDDAVVQMGGEQVAHPLDGAVVAQAEEVGALHEPAQTGGESRSRIALAVEGVEADGENGERDVDAGQRRVGDVPLPGTVTVGGRVGKEESAAAHDDTASPVDLVDAAPVELLVHMDRMPRRGSGVRAEAEPDRLGQHLVTGVALLVHVVRDMAQLPCWVVLLRGGRLGAGAYEQFVGATVGGQRGQRLRGVRVGLRPVVTDPRAPGELAVRADRIGVMGGGDQQMALGFRIPGAGDQGPAGGQLGGVIVGRQRLGGRDRRHGLLVTRGRVQGVAERGRLRGGQGAVLLTVCRRVVDHQVGVPGALQVQIGGAEVGVGARGPVLLPVLLPDQVEPG